VAPTIGGVDVDAPVGRVLHQSDGVYHRSDLPERRTGNATVDAVTIDTETDTEDRAAATDAAPAPLVEEELLVEEVSIDGMCGVY
jgi:mycofactocin precursor